jgi:hypothetical protein
MCKTFLAVALAASLALSGCKTSSTVAPAALAPGYLNPADQQMGQILEGAHQFYLQVQTDVAQGKYVPTPSEKSVLNGYAITLNVAQAEYLSYHNGTATQAQAQAAVNQVSAQEAQISAQVQTQTPVTPPK